MNRKTSLLILLVALGSCTESLINNEPQNYSEVSLSDWTNGYYAESKEPNYSDNLIYNECLEVIYEYHYEKNNEINYYDGNFRKWSFINKDSLENGVGVKHIKVTAKNPNNSYSDPQQSAISYELLNSRGEFIAKETTGVIENYKNIVLHNTRFGFFISLFSFPWPVVKFPIIENLEWEWKYAYDSKAFGDDRFFNWEGITEMNYTYKYLGEETLRLKFGNIITSKFEAVGTDMRIKNKLIYNFNSQLGFVKQMFYTHDGAIVELVAVEYNNRCE